MDDFIRADVFNYLSAVKDLYPKGIALTLLESVSGQRLEQGETDAWTVLRAEALKCSKCQREKNRQSVVFGVGGLKPKVMFVRVQPELQDDKSGQANSGPEGELLQAAVTKGMKLSLQDVYVTGLLKCYSKEQGDFQSEVHACGSYLERELQLLQPRVIVALGAEVGQCLLGNKESNKASFEEKSGSWKVYKGVPCIVTHTLAQVLAEAQNKKDFWEDLKIIMARLSGNV